MNSWRRHFIFHWYIKYHYIVELGISVVDSGTTPQNASVARCTCSLHAPCAWPKTISHGRPHQDNCHGQLCLVVGTYLQELLPYRSSTSSASLEKNVVSFSYQDWKHHARWCSGIEDESNNTLEPSQQRVVIVASLTLAIACQGKAC